MWSHFWASLTPSSSWLIGGIIEILAIQGESRLACSMRRQTGISQFGESLTKTCAWLQAKVVCNLSNVLLPKGCFQ